MLLQSLSLLIQVNEHLVGEDRQFGGNLLFKDLIPRTTWFNNVRSCVTRNSWDKLRNNKCMAEFIINLNVAGPIAELERPTKAMVTSMMLLPHRHHILMGK